MGADSKVVEKEHDIQNIKNGSSVIWLRYVVIKCIGED